MKNQTTVSGAILPPYWEQTNKTEKTYNYAKIQNPKKCIISLIFIKYQTTASCAHLHSDWELKNYSKKCNLKNNITTYHIV